MDFLDELYFQHKQEMDVFNSLCPYEIENKMKKIGHIEYFEYLKIIKMMRVLGFFEFAEIYICAAYRDMEKTTRLIVDNHILTSDYDERPLVWEFISNVYPPALREMFKKRAHEFYKEEAAKRPESRLAYEFDMGRCF